MARRPSPTRRGILRAMLSREAPLIRGHRHWFVRNWAMPVMTDDVEAIHDGGWVMAPATTGRWDRRTLVLSPSGRTLAEAATKAASAARHEEISA